MIEQFDMISIDFS